MASFNTHTAQTAATAILQSALSSGVVKLRGPGHDEESNAHNVALDADYLNNLFTSIVKNIAFE